MAKKKTVRKKKGTTSKGRTGNFWEDMRKEAKRGRVRSEFWTIPEGRSQIRVIPFLHEGKGRYFASEASHFNVVPGEPRAILCVGEDCPICEVLAGFEDPRQYEARRRWLYNLIVRGNPDQFVVGRISSVTVHDGICGYVDDDPEGVLDEKNGHDFVLEKSGAGMKTKYSSPRIMTRATLWGMGVKPVDLVALLKSRPVPDVSEMRKIARSLKG